LGTCSIDHSVAVISDVMVYSLMFALVQIYISLLMKTEAALMSSRLCPREN